MLHPYWKPEKNTQCSTVEKPKPSKKNKKWNQLGTQPRLCGLRVVPSGFLHPVAALPGANWLQVSALLKAALVTRASVLTRVEAQEVLR